MRCLSDTAWPASSASTTGDVTALAAPDAKDFDVKYAADATLAGGAASASWPTPAEVALPSPSPQLPAPSLRDIDVNMRGQTLVGVEIGMRPNAEAPLTIGHGRIIKHDRMRRVRLRWQHPVRRAKLDRQHVAAH